MKTKHRNFCLKETGLVLNPEHGWVGVSPDGIRKCRCFLDIPSLVEFKCPYTGKDMESKTASILDSVGGAIDSNGLSYIRKNHIYYFQIQNKMK